MARNTSAIIGCELLAAAQGIDLRRPLQTTPILEGIVAAVRERVTFIEVDRYMAPDIAATTAMVEDGYFYDIVSAVLPSAQ